MALKAPKTEHLSEPLTGEDADRLVEYMTHGERPVGHADYLAASDAMYAQTHSRESANAFFENAAR